LINSKQTYTYLLNRRSFDQQTLQLNSLLKQAQDDHDAQRKAMLKAMQEENLLLAKQKRN